MHNLQCTMHNEEGTARDGLRYGAGRRWCGIGYATVLDGDGAVSATLRRWTGDGPVWVLWIDDGNQKNVERRLAAASSAVLQKLCIANCALNLLRLVRQVA